MTLDDWLKILPYVGGAVGVLLNGALLMYNAKVAAKKNDVDAGSTSLQAASSLSLDMAQRADIHYRECVDDLEETRGQLASAVALNMKYYTVMARIVSVSEDILRRHRADKLVDCPAAAGYEARLVQIIAEVTKVIDENPIDTQPTKPTKAQQV